MNPELSEQESNLRGVFSMSCTTPPDCSGSPRWNAAVTHPGGVDRSIQDLKHARTPATVKPLCALLAALLCACASDSPPVVATRPAVSCEAQRYQEYCRPAERQTLFHQNQVIKSKVQ